MQCGRRSQGAKGNVFSKQWYSQKAKAKQEGRDRKQELVETTGVKEFMSIVGRKV